MSHGTAAGGTSCIAATEACAQHDDEAGQYLLRLP